MGGPRFERTIVGTGRGITGNRLSMGNGLGISGNGLGNLILLGGVNRLPGALVGTILIVRVVVGARASGRDMGGTNGRLTLLTFNRAILG